MRRWGTGTRAFRLLPRTVSIRVQVAFPALAAELPQRTSLALLVGLKQRLRTVYGCYRSPRLVARNSDFHLNPVPEPQNEQYEDPSAISLPHCLQYISVLLSFLSRTSSPHLHYAGSITA